MIRRLVYRIGRRGAALLFFAGLDAVIAWSMFQTEEARPPTYQYADTFAPLWAWAILWGVCGAVCAVTAFLRVDWVGFAAAMAVKALWGLVLAGGAVTGHIPRGLAAAVVWLTFAAFVWLLSTWPEPPCPRGGHE